MLIGRGLLASSISQAKFFAAARYSNDTRATPLERIERFQIMRLLICQTPDCWAPATTRDTETKTIYCLRCGGINAANRIIEKEGLAGLRLEEIMPVREDVA